MYSSASTITKSTSTFSQVYEDLFCSTNLLFFLPLHLPRPNCDEDEPIREKGEGEEGRGKGNTKAGWKLKKTKFSINYYFPLSGYVCGGSAPFVRYHHHHRHRWMKEDVEGERWERGGRKGGMYMVVLVLKKIIDERPIINYMTDFLLPPPPGSPPFFCDFLLWLFFFLVE
ncbi:hypothetical protein GGS21DRAFT_38078 [Xylaria nigripes]|nr:hypothetical protein GGS21DRAFT_38078 [Xylaria nigripes]